MKPVSNYPEYIILSLATRPEKTASEETPMSCWDTRLGITWEAVVQMIIIPSSATGQIIPDVGMIILLLVPLPGKTDPYPIAISSLEVRPDQTWEVIKILSLEERPGKLLQGLTILLSETRPLWTAVVAMVM